jgi:hypothetical protein
MRPRATQPRYPSSQGATSISYTTVRAEKPYQPTRKYVSSRAHYWDSHMSSRVSRSRTMLLLTGLV